MLETKDKKKSGDLIHARAGFEMENIYVLPLK